MTTYEQMFGSLHNDLLAPKSAMGKPKPLKHATPAKTTPQRPRGPSAGPTLPAPPPPPGSLGIPDLPPEIEATVAQILAADPENGAARALAYIRGTDWYKAAYVGIGAGIKSGVISSEADYRAYASSVAQTFARYYGRAPTPAELSNFLAQGYSPGVVEQIGVGHAWATANAGETQYELGAFGEGRLSEADLETLGQQQVGLGSNAGAGLQARLQKAGDKMQRLFAGTLASPSFQLGGAGLSAPSLLTKQKPDVSA